MKRRGKKAMRQRRRDKEKSGRRYHERGNGIREVRESDREKERR
jgi:hypothetical protein